jgi:hypothetical protein
MLIYEFQFRRKYTSKKQYDVYLRQIFLLITQNFNNFLREHSDHENDLYFKK